MAAATQGPGAVGSADQSLLKDVVLAPNAVPSGPPVFYSTVNGALSAEYSAAFTRWTEQGYVPTALSAVRGPDGVGRFNGIFTKDPAINALMAGSLVNMPLNRPTPSGPRTAERAVGTYPCSVQRVKAALYSALSAPLTVL